MVFPCINVAPLCSCLYCVHQEVCCLFIFILLYMTSTPLLLYPVTYEILPLSLILSKLICFLFFFLSIFLSFPSFLPSCGLLSILDLWGCGKQVTLAARAKSRSPRIFTHCLAAGSRLVMKDTSHAVTRWNSTCLARRRGRTRSASSVSV